MATTSSTLVAGKALASQGGNGNNGRYGLKAKLAAGVAILGCAAALAFGGLRAGEGAQSPAVAPAITSAQTDVRAQQVRTLVQRENPEPYFPTILLTANLSDTGNAECIAELLGERIVFCHTRKKWFMWDRVRWRADSLNRIQQVAVRVARERQRAALTLNNFDERKRLLTWAISSENVKRVDSALKAAQSLKGIGVSADSFDQNPFLATVKNGTLELKDGIFRSSCPEDYLTKQLGAEYSPEATAPRWTQFLEEVFGGDQEMISYIQRAVGYSLTGDASEQVLFLCYGNGANGKSVFLEVLDQLLGDYAATASFETFDAGRRGDSSNDLAALQGKRFVTVIETDDDRRLAEAKVKSVTGQDSISCRFLYGEFFTYRPQFKIWMAMNHMPVIRGTDRGIWRRIHLIPFTQSFEGRADKSLSGKLRSELSGILNWALEGLREWQRVGLNVPQAVREATEEYRRESDSIGQWVEERLSKNPAAEMPAKKGYGDSNLWTLERGEKPFSQKRWGISMKERGFEKKRVSAGYVYSGVELNRR